MITEIGLESAEVRREAAEKNVMYRMTLKYALKFLSVIAIVTIFVFPIFWM